MVRLMLLVTVLVAATIAATPPPMQEPGSQPQPVAPPTSAPQVPAPTAAPTASPTPAASATPAAALAAAWVPPNPPSGGMPQPAQPPPAPAPLDQLQPSPGASGTPAPVDPAMMTQAKLVFTQMQGGTLDRSLLEPAMSTALTDQQLSAMKSSVGPLGAPVGFTQQRAGTQGNFNYALYLITFKDGSKLNLLYVIDKQGKIAGLRLAPAQ